MKHYKIKKHLYKYVKDCSGTGYSLSSIHKALIKYGYSDYADGLIRNYKIEKCIKIAVPLLITFVLIFGLFTFKPAITGLFVAEKQFNFSDSVNLEFNESSEYIWNPQQQGLLKSLKVDGSYKIEGNARIYLEDDGIKYLIFDSSKSNTSELASITGLVVSDKNKTNGKDKDKGNKTKDKNKDNTTIEINETIVNQTNTTIINQTIDITQIINETIEINQSIINLTNETITNETKELINKTIKVNLEYKKDTIYDPNNDGIEDIYGVIDLTVENTNFDWDINENNLCTRWNIESVDTATSTIFCNGAQNCCSFVDLSSTNSNWNEALFLTYGLYGSTFTNTVSAQVIHVDYNLSADAPYSEIYYSDWGELPVKFQEKFTAFDNICEETCILSLNKSTYKLIIEMDNSILKLDNINYIVERKEANNPPTLIKNIPNLKIDKDDITIDLNEYFIDLDNDLLIYNYFQAKNITVNIQNNLATIIPDENFEGTVYMFFIANDSYETTVSNVFSVNITKEEKETINRSRIVINSPVKWLKKVKLDEITSNVSINITSFATNITVKKIENDISEEIPEERIKINDNGEIKSLKQYELEKEIEKLNKKINEEDDVEIKEEYKEKIDELEEILEVIREEKDEITVSEETNLITGNVVIENKKENGSHSQAIAPRQNLKSPRTNDIKQNLFKYLSVEDRETKLGSHSPAIASDLRSGVLHEHAGSNSFPLGLEFPPPASNNKITGFATAETTLNTTSIEINPENNINTIEVIIEDLVEEVEIEYYTEGPSSKEIELGNNRKQIVISSDIHYEDILAFTFLPIEAKSESVKLFWLINNTKIAVIIDKFDKNDNNLIDYIEWIVPSLSNQTYELIIEITKAEHLDANRVFVEDVYELVKARDNIWTGEIPANHYIRVVFEQNLTKDNDITIYARSNYLNSSIEVYEKDENVTIATFETINEDKKYQIFLTNLIGSQDIFDLKIINSPVEFDYIVDPTIVENASNFTTALVTHNWTITNISGGFIQLDGQLHPKFSGDANKDSDLVLLFHLNNDSSVGENDTLFFDWSDAGNNGSCSIGDNKCPVYDFTDRKLGSAAIKFDGSSNYIEVNDSNTLDINESLTITAWIKIDSMPRKRGKGRILTIDDVGFTFIVGGTTSAFCIICTNNNIIYAVIVKVS